MKLEDLPDDFTPEQFMELDADSLNQIPFETGKWQCKIKFCKCFTRVRGYSINPFFYHKRGTKDLKTGLMVHWFDCRNRFFICQKHKKYWKKEYDEIPFKKNKNGIFWGGDDTGKEYIIY